jgi:hypothetical protein
MSWLRAEDLQARVVRREGVHLGAAEYDDKEPRRHRAGGGCMTNKDMQPVGERRPVLLDVVNTDTEENGGTQTYIPATVNNTTRTHASYDWPQALGGR